MQAGQIHRQWIRGHTLNSRLRINKQKEDAAAQLDEAEARGCNAGSAG
jgi:hypothetical protein